MAEFYSAEFPFQPQDIRQVLSKYFAKVEPNHARIFEGTPCWEWQGSLTSIGYSQFHMLGEALAHRVAHILFIGEIPDGLHIDHRCRNRACVSPLHLEAITPTENRRRRNEAKTTCSKGHPFTEESVYLYQEKIYNSFSRRCRICARIRQREFHKRHPEAQARYLAKKARGESV